MQLQDILFSQGFGTRRVTAGLVQRGLVAVCPEGADAFTTPTNSTLDIAPEGLQFKVRGVSHLDPNFVWTYCDLAYVVLNKPAGYECSHKPSAWPSIYTLLPSPLRERPNKNAIQGVQAVGRLDQDTTGLLILTDDGALIHKLSSPKHHAPKVYEVSTKHPVTEGQINKLLSGVVLDDSPKPVRAAAAVQTGDLSLQLTLTEGKYHQVKRMIAAVSNRVEGLHRSQMGTYELPKDLSAGQWRFLNTVEVAALSAKSA